MTADEFNSRLVGERAKLVWTCGEFLTMRQRHGCRVVLYHLEELFVEVWYRPASNSILMVSALEEQACLEPYLEQISIASLTASR